MSPKLDVVVTDCGTDLDCVAGVNTVKYTGTLAAMTAPIALGTFAGGEERRYEFSVAFNSSGTNASRATTPWPRSPGMPLST